MGRKYKVLTGETIDLDDVIAVEPVYVTNIGSAYIVKIKGAGNVIVWRRFFYDIHLLEADNAALRKAVAENTVSVMNNVFFGTAAYVDCKIDEREFGGMAGYSCMPMPDDKVFHFDNKDGTLFMEVRTQQCVTHPVLAKENAKNVIRLNLFKGVVIDLDEVIRINPIYPDRALQVQFDIIMKEYTVSIRCRNSFDNDYHAFLDEYKRIAHTFTQFSFKKIVREKNDNSGSSENTISKSQKMEGEIDEFLSKFDSFREGTDGKVLLKIRYNTDAVAGEKTIWRLILPDWTELKVQRIKIGSGCVTTLDNMPDGKVKGHISFLVSDIQFVGNLVEVK